VASAAINSPGIQLIRRTANELTLFVKEDVRAAIPRRERSGASGESARGRIYRGEEDKITLSPKAPSTRGGAGGVMRNREGAAEKRGENHVP